MNPLIIPHKGHNVEAPDLHNKSNKPSEKNPGERC